MVHQFPAGTRGSADAAAFRRPVYGRLTPLTAADALHLLRDHPDARFVLDPKEGNAPPCPRSFASTGDRPEAVDRLIPQVLTLDDLLFTFSFTPGRRFSMDVERD